MGTIFRLVRPRISWKLEKRVDITSSKFQTIPYNECEKVHKLNSK